MYRISMRIGLILSIAFFSAGCLQDDVPPSPNEPLPEKEDSIPSQQSYGPGIVSASSSLV